MILFIADFPTEKTIKEGMSQRISVIDKHFESEQRIYLRVSHRFFAKKVVLTFEENVIQYQCNLFIHFFFILKLLKRADLIYFHSILNAFTVLPFFSFIKKKKTVLDVHGVVPEEQLLNGNRQKSTIYNFTEKKLFQFLDYAIVVTNRMKDFYIEKYPLESNQIKFIVFPILPKHILVEEESNYQLSVDNDGNEKIIVIDSGNTQKWQNVDQMIETIRRNISEHINYTILTGEEEVFKNKFIEAGVNPEESNIDILSVLPEQLKKYYEKANYGFVLRDDIDVNNVACPTKLIEYLYYGITPIVKSEKIGDFDNLGFEYLKVEDFTLAYLNAGKSKKNNEIIQLIISSGLIKIKEEIS